MNDGAIEIIKTIVPVLGTLFGTLSGVWLTQKYQNRAFDRQINVENNRKKEMRLEKQMKLYGEILYLDGQSLMIYEENRVFHLNIDDYKDKFRPVIYSGVYYFEEYPLKIIRSIDHRIADCDFREEVNDEDHSFFAYQYNELINYVGSEISKYQNNIK